MKLHHIKILLQGSKFKFEFGSTRATRCEFLGTQLTSLGAQLIMLGPSISKEKVKSLTITPCHVHMSSSICYFYFSPVTDKTQSICYTVIPF